MAFELRENFESSLENVNSKDESNQIWPQIDSDLDIDRDEEWDKRCSRLSPQSSTSSGYNSSSQSSEESVEETEPLFVLTGNDGNARVDPGWDQPDPFDPNNPYRNEPLAFPPELRLFWPQTVHGELQKLPCRRLTKPLPRKRVCLSPEIKAKVCKSTGIPKRSPQFLGPDSDSEESDSD